jgi:hypothetical protein
MTQERHPNVGRGRRIFLASALSLVVPVMFGYVISSGVASAADTSTATSTQTASPSPSSESAEHSVHADSTAICKNGTVHGTTVVTRNDGDPGGSATATVTNGAHKDGPKAVSSGGSTTFNVTTDVVKANFVTFTVKVDYSDGTSEQLNSSADGPFDCGSTPPPPTCKKSTVDRYTYSWNGSNKLTMTPKVDICEQSIVWQLYQVPSTWDGKDFNASASPQPRVDTDTKTVKGTDAKSFTVDLSKLTPFKNDQGKCISYAQVDAQNAPGQPTVVYPQGSSQPLYFGKLITVHFPQSACKTTPPLTGTPTGQPVNTCTTVGVSGHNGTNKVLWFEGSITGSGNDTAVSDRKQVKPGGDFTLTAPSTAGASYKLSLNAGRSLKNLKFHLVDTTVVGKDCTKPVTGTPTGAYSHTCTTVNLTGHNGTNVVLTFNGSITSKNVANSDVTEDMVVQPGGNFALKTKSAANGKYQLHLQATNQKLNLHYNNLVDNTVIGKDCSQPSSTTPTPTSNSDTPDIVQSDGGRGPVNTGGMPLGVWLAILAGLGLAGGSLVAGKVRIVRIRG